MTSLAIHLFGPADIRVNGQPLPPLRSRSGLWLLALLVLRHPRPVERDWLAGVLWPESTQEQALANLRQRLSELRRVMGDEGSRLLTPNTRTLALNLDEAEVDVIAFETALKRGEPSDTDQALALYHGPLLEGCTEEWVVQERLIREQAYLQALEQAAGSAVAANDPTKAAAHLRHLIGVDPLRESAHCALLQALAASGDYAAAVQVYRDLRLMLRREMNTEPAAETTALFKQIRRQGREDAKPGRWPMPDNRPARLRSDDDAEFATLSPTGTVTFLFTDIEGSTRLWEQHANQMRAALARHDSILREAIESNNGYVFKTVGDAFCAAFSTALDAASAAIAAQLELATEPWAGQTPIKVRMALHIGVAETRNNDYFGQVLNHLARLLSAGHGGQVLISGVTEELLRDNLPANAELRLLGDHHLRDLSRPITVFQLLHPGLDPSFPPLKSLDNPELPNNLPRQLTSFIGREREISEVAVLLEKTGLLTLTGSGGCGKTRLSLQVAAHTLDGFVDGVWLVELASLTDPALVSQAIAQALRIKEQPGQPIQNTLIDRLKPKQTLLVLDNCEHLLDACARLTTELLRGCSNLKVLATSREPMGIAGELTYRVPSLPLPNLNVETDPHDLNQFEAVRLFVDRAQLHKPDFAVTRDDAVELAQICCRLDGMPLAIELAAARIRSLPLTEINRRLESRFRLLTGGDRAALPRHQTLSGLIDWSYDLLSESEKVLLRRLSVFAGGWTLAAAEAVCGNDGETGPSARSSYLGAEGTRRGDGKTRGAVSTLYPLPSTLSSHDVLDLVTSLVDKSLVVYDERRQDSDGRYRMLETIRQYALDRLIDNGEWFGARDRHLNYFLEWAEQIQPKLNGPEQTLWLGRLEREHDNLRAAASFSLEEDKAVLRETSTRAVRGLRLAGALYWFWHLHSHLNEGRSRLEQLLARTAAQDNPRARAQALQGAGQIAFYQSDYSGAERHLTSSVALWREIGDLRGLSGALVYLGGSHIVRGDRVTALAIITESVACARESGDTWSLAMALWWQGMQYHFAGCVEEGEPDLEESAKLFRQLGATWGIVGPLIYLAEARLARDDPGAAKVFGEEGLAAARVTGDTWRISALLDTLGEVALYEGDFVNARRRFEESLEICREIRNTRRIAYELRNLGHTARREGHPDEALNHYKASLGLYVELADKSHIANVLDGFARLAATSGRVETAARLFGSVESLRDSIDARLIGYERADYNRAVQFSRAELGEAAYSEHLIAGRAFSMEQAIEMAMAFEVA